MAAVAPTPQGTLPQLGSESLGDKTFRMKEKIRLNDALHDLSDALKKSCIKSRVRVLAQIELPEPEEVSIRTNSGVEVREISHSPKALKLESAYLELVAACKQCLSDSTWRNAYDLAEGLHKPLTQFKAAVGDCLNVYPLVTRELKQKLAAESSDPEIFNKHTEVLPFVPSGFYHKGKLMLDIPTGYFSYWEKLFQGSDGNFDPIKGVSFLNHSTCLLISARSVVTELNKLNLPAPRE